MNVRELTPVLKKYAKKELGEDESKLEEHIQVLKKWLEKQPHINARSDPQCLTTFLRGCKHSIERTKEKLDTYYTMKTHIPEIFGDKDPELPKIKDLLNQGIYLPLPATRKPDSPRIVVIRGGIYNPSEFNFLDVTRVVFMIMDIMLVEDDQAAVAGIETIIDLTGSVFEHVSQFTPTVVKKAVMCFQDAYPLRPKSMHFINIPPSFDLVYSVFKLFMKDKLRNRITVHSDINELYKRIPKDVLPSDLGGVGPSYAELAVEWKQKVLDRRDWFIEDTAFRVDESKRVGKKVTGADLFGVDGSFKQLSID